MSSADKIHALRGMRDVFSADFARHRRVQAALESLLRAHAYVPIDLPIVENTELFLRKSGEDIAARLYEFNFRGRRIALRPEITASVLRAYVERLQDEPLPLRIQYSGPVFRYEKPSAESSPSIHRMRRGIAWRSRAHGGCRGDPLGLPRTRITSYKQYETCHRPYRHIGRVPELVGLA